MRDHYDFSNGRKNPYAESIRKNGYSVTVHYSPKDVAEMNITEKYELTPDEIAVIEEYRANRKAQ